VRPPSPCLRLAVAVVGGGLALGGCASPAAPDAPTGSGTATATTTPTATAPPPVDPVPRCTTADVSLTLRRGDAAAGSAYSLLRMRNTTTSACRTRGFGGVSYVVRPGGARVGAAAEHVQRDQARPLTVQPGAAVQATLRETSAGNYPTAACRPTRAAGLRVRPPGETRWVFLAHPTQACASVDVHLLELTPYVPTA
jgi:hypothetical protein